MFQGVQRSTTTGESNYQELDKILAEIDVVGKDLAFLDFEGGEPLVNISRSLLKVAPKHTATLILVCMTLGYKVEKYHQRPKLSAAISGSLAACRVYIPNKGSSNRKPGPGQVRMQQIPMALPPVAIKAMEMLANGPNRHRVFDLNYQINIRYAWPGSLVIYWASEGTDLGKIAKCIADYANFIEMYISKRANAVTAEKARALSLINRSWLGKLLDAYSYKTLEMWLKGQNVIPEPGGFNQIDKTTIFKHLGWNPWAQIRQPPLGQIFNSEYADSVDSQLKKLI